ncbi:MAG: hypothetical protein AB7S26_29850 [Sandaracinaceae bacterium]
MGYDMTFDWALAGDNTLVQTLLASARLEVAISERTLSGRSEVVYSNRMSTAPLVEGGRLVTGP